MTNDELVTLGEEVSELLAIEEHEVALARLLMLRFRFEGELDDEGKELIARRFYFAARLAFDVLTLARAHVDEMEDERVDEMGSPELLGLFLHETLQLRDPVKRIAWLIGLSIGLTDSNVAAEQAYSIGELEPGDNVDHLMVEFEPPPDYVERLERAAVAALDAYYAP